MERTTRSAELDIRYALDGAKLSELSERAIVRAMDGIEGLTREQAAELKLDISTEEEYGSTSATATVPYERPETDAEMAYRVASAKHLEEWQRKQYLELKKKFEGSDK